MVDEGLSLTPYPDPDSPLGEACTKLGLDVRDYRRVPNWSEMNGSPWTNGYGNTRGVLPGVTITEAQAEADLDANVHGWEIFLGTKLPWFENLDPVRQDVLTNIAFNVGGDKLLKWPTTLGFFRSGDWVSAKHALLTEGPWDAEVKGRAIRLANVTYWGDWARINDDSVQADTVQSQLQAEATV